mgnify:CR=1 FL=1
MKKKIRFSDLSVGDQFEWAGKTLRKDGVRTATVLSPHQSFVFSNRDMVQIDCPEDVEDDFFVPGIGLVKAPDPNPIDPQDLYDAYFQNTRDDSLPGTGSSPQDKCN